MQRAAWPKALGYGDAVPWSNMGEMDSWGYEFSTNYAYQINKDWRVDFAVTLLMRLISMYIKTNLTILMIGSCTQDV